jgi:hypothetical protein
MSQIPNLPRGSLLKPEKQSPIMQARELFGLALRLGGLVFLVFSLFDFVQVLLNVLGTPDPSATPLAATSFAATIYLAIGVIGLLGADWLVCLSYGPDKG